MTQKRKSKEKKSKNLFWNNNYFIIYEASQLN